MHKLSSNEAGVLAAIHDFEYPAFRELPSSRIKPVPYAFLQELWVCGGLQLNYLGEFGEMKALHEALDGLITLGYVLECEVNKQKQPELPWTGKYILPCGRTIVAYWAEFSKPEDVERGCYILHDFDFGNFNLDEVIDDHGKLKVELLEEYVDLDTKFPAIVLHRNGVGPHPRLFTLTVKGIEAARLISHDNGGNKVKSEHPEQLRLNEQPTSELTGTGPTNSESQGLQALKRWRFFEMLGEHPESGLLVRELPEEFLDPDFLTVCDADELIEFGQRKHCRVGGGDGELRIESGWEFGSVIGPNYKPMAEFIREAISTIDVDPLIQPHVRLTAQGQVELARLRTTTDDGQDGSEINESQIDDDSLLAPAKLAKIFNVPADPLRTRLNRWRMKNLDGWIENTERGPREPQYLYRVGTVRHIIEEMKTTSKRPANDQRKKT